MKVSGFTFVRDAVKYGYPVVESIQSMLPICDEVVVVVGNSSDDTLEMIHGINSDKIRIIETIWDESLREGGKILAQQTDIALSNCLYDWCFYLQADEVLHEKFYQPLRSSMEKNIGDHRVQGLLFDYVHFYGSYWTVGTGRQWYRKEIRVVRNNIGVRSFRDAQGFRLNGNKLQVKHSGAQIFHYGWAKPQDQMTAKQKNLDRFWHRDDDIEKKYLSPEFKIFGDIENISMFNGTHPMLMNSRVGELDPNIERLLNQRKKRKSILKLIEEDILHTRIGEYKNYKLI
ncbi:MAG: glycosyl transferase [Chlorobiaceae bacterium]|nr:glycosyl transferase [Chlorobiaceae bacterium]